MFKKLLTALTVAAALLLPSAALAQVTTHGGGTGLVDVASGAIPFGSVFNLRLGTSTNFTFNNAANRLSVTYASSTAFSAATLCLTGDICRTTWPSGGSSASSTLLADTNTWSGTENFTTNTGFGVTAPGQALDIVGKIRQANTLTDATNKAFYFLDRNFTNAQNDFLLVFGQSKTSGNTLIFGGGQTGFTAASSIAFFTGAGNNTDTGASRLAIDATGNVTVTSLTGGAVYTGPNGILLNTPTTTATCAGTASCSAFTVFGNSPVTITGSGSVSGSGTISTSSPIAAGAAALYATGVNTVASVATSTPSIGSVLTYTGTLGNLIGGTSGTFGIANNAVTNGMLANSSVTINTSGGLTGGGSLSLGGTLNLSSFSYPFPGGATTTLVQFTNASSTLFSTVYGSTTRAQIGQLTLSTTTAGCLNTSSSGVVYAATCTGSSGTPGGSNTQVQFNNSGSFGGDADFTYAGTGEIALGGSGTSGTVDFGDAFHQSKIRNGGTSNLIVDTSGNFIIENHGSGFEAIFDTSVLSANRTFTFPDTSGTFCLTSTCDTFAYPFPGGATTTLVQFTNATSTLFTASTAWINTLGKALNGGGFQINNIAAPTSGGDAANKTYVDNAIAGVNPAVAVTAATTQASDTNGLTYNNGASGIGATFTGSNNTAITVDGVTFTAINQRLLVKNDTQSPSGAFNGVYYVTQVQTAILPPILTRALDYDMPSDINSTGAIPVVSGTANANTSWLLTSSVTTVGTDPLTYVQFSLAPSTIVTTSRSINTTFPLQGGGNLSADRTLTSAFGTTSTWGMGNNGLVMTGPTGIPFVQATSSAIALSITGNAATVTTNANLTGVVTSSGNATSFAASPTFTGTVTGGTFAGAGTSLTGTAAGLSIGGNAATVTTNANLSGVITSSGNVTSFGSQAAGILGSVLTGNTTVLSTSTLFGVVTPGFHLAFLNGAWTPIATTTYSCSSGITCSFSANQESYSIGNNAITLAMMPTLAANSVWANLTSGTANATAVATSSLFSGSTGQFGFFSGTGALVGTSSIFANTASFIGIASTTPFSRLSVGTGHASSSITVAEYRYGSAGNLATSTASNIDCRTSNTIHWPIGTAATTLTLSSMTPGQVCNVVVENPNATAGALTWAVSSGNIIEWSGGSAPSQTTTANAIDVWSFIATQGSSTIVILGTAGINFK